MRGGPKGKGRPQPSNHPWRKALTKQQSLVSARKAAKARYDKERNKDEFIKTLNRVKMRKYRRRKLGLDTNIPPMKPWDCAKGKIASNTMLAAEKGGQK